jgi:hypothetical protein
MRAYTIEDLRRLKSAQGIAVHIMASSGLVDLLDLTPGGKEHDRLNGAQIESGSSTVLVLGRLSNCSTSNSST